MRIGLRAARLLALVPPRLWRVGALVLTAGILAAIPLEILVGFLQGRSDFAVGTDFAVYVEAARSWTSGHGFYLARQLQGPYPIELGDVLYPPTTLWVFVPFTILPGALWWTVAIGLLAYVVWTWRPAMWTWPVMASGLAYGMTPLMYVRGSPVIMVAALVAAGLRWGWPGAFVLLKPSVLPFALAGIRSRGWWLTAALVGLLTLPFLPMIPEWIRAMVDGQGGGLLYSINDVPLLIVPVVAWLGRTPRGVQDSPRRRSGGSPCTAALRSGPAISRQGESKQAREEADAAGHALSGGCAIVDTSDMCGSVRSRRSRHLARNRRPG
jgi:hypothetical protein